MEITRTEPKEGRAHSPQRTCVGCGERAEKARGAAELVRLILGPDGEVAVDAGGGGFGRGAYAHPRRDCLAKAVQRGLPRAAKGRVSTLVAASEEGEADRIKLTVDSLAEAVQAALHRRIRGLLVSAGRSRSLALGADAVTGACERGEADVVIVACDAAAGAELPAVRKAISEGRAVAWGTKLELGALCGGGSGRKQQAGLAVVAVKSGSIAKALLDAVRAADACRGGQDSGENRRADSKKNHTKGTAAGAAADRRSDSESGKRGAG